METLDGIYFASSVLNAGFATVFGILSFYHARKRKSDPLFYYLLTGFFACIFLGCTYYSFTTVLLEYPYVISPGDLSWVGAIVFLITAILGVMDDRTQEQRAASHRYRLIALLAPAICVLFNIAYISIYPEIIANYLLYGIPTAILSYYALWQFLSSGQDVMRSAMRSFYLVILLWITTQLLHDLFSSLGWDYGYAAYMTVCDLFTTLLMPCIYFAARRGACE